jgi:hypothetical protein
MQQKPTRFTFHAAKQAAERGANENEVVETILSESWEPAELGRWECRKNFPFGEVWNEKSYATKQVRPVFVDEPNEIVVITVYVYYF